MRNIRGITVAFLSGIYDRNILYGPWGTADFDGTRYTRMPINRIKAQAKKETANGHVDILLTSEMAEFLLAPDPLPLCISRHRKSPAVRELLLEMRPRYHISAGPSSGNLIDGNSSHQDPDIAWRTYRTSKLADYVKMTHSPPWLRCLLFESA